MRVAGFLFIVAALLACSGSDSKKPGDGTTPPPPFTPVDFCNARREAQCASIASCYPGEPTLKGKGTTSCYRDPDLHADYVACMATALPAMRGLDRKTLDWDETGAKACIAQMKAVCPGEGLPALGAACPIRKLLKGKAKVGKVCYMQYQLFSIDPLDIFSDCDSEGYCYALGGNCYGSCQSFELEGDPCGGDCAQIICGPGLSCAAGSGQSCGKCQVSTAGGGCTTSADCRAGFACHKGACERPVAGEPCVIDASGSFCAAPSVCIPGAADPTKGTCGARVAAGSPCVATWQCKESLVCAFDDKGAGSCQTPIAASAPCFRPPATALTSSDPCVATAQCVVGTDGTTATCVPMVPLGMDCRTADDPMGPLDCAEGFCRTAPGNTNGICSALLSKGNGCDATADACDPAQGLRCSAGQCKPAGSGQTGDNCKDDSDCASGICIGGSSFKTCQPPCSG